MGNSKMSKNIHSLIREKNQILNKWEQYYRKEELQSFPSMIQLPTGTRCNIHCRFCTDRKKENAKDYTDLRFDEFRSIIENGDWNQALRLVKSIDLYGWGEPLCNPDYEKIFDYLAENFPGLGINISTNGILFDQKWSDKIVAIDNSEVNFSVNAATRETYHNLTGSNRFEGVIENIHGLISAREKCRTKNPYVSLSYVATTENIRELSQFVNLAADLKADIIKVQDVMILNKETEKLSLVNKADLAYKMFKIAEEQARKRGITIWSYVTHQVNYFQSFEPTEGYDYFSIGAKEEEIQPSENEEIPSPYSANTDCFDPWEAFQVAANGEVWPCCRFQNVPGVSLGNIYEQSFEDIWNGEAYRNLRRTINTNNPPLVCAICPRKAGLE